MTRSLSDFTDGIDGLVSHLNYEKSCHFFFKEGVRKYSGDSVLEKEFQGVVRNEIVPSLVGSKVYSYKNAIITVYGLLERFVEDVVVEYLQLVCESAKTYRDIPSKIRKSHLDVSLDHIGKLKRIKGFSSGQGSHDLGGAVKNMHDCLVESPGCSLNFEAYVNHSSNFRYDSIHDIFNRVGIDSISRVCIDYSDELRDLLIRKHSSGVDLDRKTLISLLVAELDDLAQRRNEIAHGARVDDIESLDITLERIELIRRYVIGLNSVILSSLERYYYAVLDKVDLGKPVRSYSGINVLEFSSAPNCEQNSGRGVVRVGDKVFAVNESSPKKVVSGEVISIWSPDGELEELKVPDEKKFSIGVSFDFNSNIMSRVIFVSASKE